VIETACLRGADLGAFWRERGLYPWQRARWRAGRCYRGRRLSTPEALDANSPTAPSPSDHRKLQRRNQEQVREIRHLARELRRKEQALSDSENWSGALHR
jgi:hypothetical protein